MNASEALQTLKDGNRRYVAEWSRQGSGVDARRRINLTAGQAPLAAVIGCSDSRVPVEIVFDQGLGDIFVIRVAGNVIRSSQIESVEYAVAELGVPLVVVLGHEGCGAVAAAVEDLRADTPPLELRLPTLMESLRPVVEPRLPGVAPDAIDAAFLHEAVRANVCHAVARVRERSALVTEREKAGELILVGAEYGLTDGAVTFLDPR